MSGKFISFEGGEGAGKSTQAALLAENLKRKGIDCVLTREPGGTDGAEAIRELIVTGDSDRWSARTETLLIMAARSDHMERVIMPALQRGAWVVCDRWQDSTIIYQGMVKKLGKEWVLSLYRSLFGGFSPNLTFYMDISPEIGLKRTQSRKNSSETRFESMDMAFHEALRSEFLSLCNDHPRCHIVDAEAEQGIVTRQIFDCLNNNFNINI